MASEPERVPRDAPVEPSSTDVAADVRARYGRGQSIRGIAAGTGLTTGVVRAILDHGRPPRWPQPEDERRHLADLVERGVVVAPTVPKGTPPVPLDCDVRLSDIVIADRV